MEQTKNMVIDPIEIDDDLEITEEVIEETEMPSDIEETTEEEEIDFTDDDDDSNSDKDSDDDDIEEKPVKSKVKKVSKGFEEATVRRVPVVGQIFKAKYFSIQIVDKRGNQYDCQVITCVNPSRLKVGEIFEAEEVAFYSDYYEFGGYAK
jgi:hypothetical protein